MSSALGGDGIDDLATGGLGEDDAMKTWSLLLSILLAGLFLATNALAASVRGHYRKDGTYVQPHYRTNPDSNPYNNYNFPGNHNPNTGRITGGDQNRYLDNYYKQDNNGFGSGSSTRPRW